MDKKKMIGDIVTSITDKELKKDYFYNAVPLAVILGKDAKEGTLWAAFASYAPGCKMIEVAAICDNTILGSGKKGILFSTEGIYGSMFHYSTLSPRNNHIFHEQKRYKWSDTIYTRYQLYFSLFSCWAKPLELLSCNLVKKKISRNFGKI